MPRTVVFLSDFGLADEFVGVCHGVVERVVPGCTVIDLTHAVPPQDVRRGALLLARAAPYMPADSVFLAVVDPGVGGARRPVAVEAASGASLIGPDNGILSLAWRALGGAVAARTVSSPEVILSPTSATFHGRDVFAPAAAHLAAGRSADALGPPVEPATLLRLTVPPAEAVPGTIRCRVIAVDRYGNVELSATAEDLRRSGLDGDADLAVETPRGQVRVARAATFGDVEPGRPAILVDSAGWLTVTVNRGRADDAFGLRPDDAVAVRAPVDG